MNDKVEVTGEVKVNGDGAAKLLSAIAIGIAVIGLLAVFGYSNTSRDIAENAKATVDAFERGRTESRADTCKAFFDLYRTQRNQIARNDVIFQSGAYDKILPSFATPEVKRVTHKNAVKNFRRFGNAKLPSFCPQRREPEAIPKGFKLE